MKVWYDTEFLEDGRTIDLISIGMVKEDGSTYYAVNSEMSCSRIALHPWLMQNVIRPHIPTKLVGPDGALSLRWEAEEVKPKAQIAEEVLKFLAPSKEDPIELNAYYCAYDHVVLCQLWGPMVTMPPGIPWFTRDLKVEAERLGLDTKSEGWPIQTPEFEHHALQDAYHDQDIDKFLREQANGR